MEGKSLSLNEFSHISHKPESIISKTEKIQACSFTSPITENQNEDKFSQKVNPQTEIEKGKWTREEHRKFIVAILTYGNNWKKVQKFIKTRSCSQARSHAQKFLNKLKHVNFVDFKVTSSLSSISVLQEYILILNKEEKQKFVTFLNDILFEEDFSHINRIENDFVRNKENPRINNIRPNVTVSSSQNNSSCFYYPNSFNYPSGNYLPMTCYTYNTPYNELLYSPHLNNYNYYGFNMNMFNSTEIYPQNYFPASIPICQAPCYSLVQENGQLIYKLIPNFYGVIYPYQQNGFNSQPPFQEKVNLENKRIEFNEKERKNNNRVFKINKKVRLNFKL
jgi:SHAQKYF class myb-like DNA-binding protein